MSATKVFVGVDAGTTGCTVMIFDEAGRAVGHGYQEYDCTSPQPGWIEQDMEAVWQGICSACKQAVAQADLPAEAYHSLGLSSQRGTFAMLDEAKTPIGNSLVWNCGRALKYVDGLEQEFPGENEHQLHTGMQISPLWAAAKIAWLADKRKADFDKTRWFANGQEYFLYRMGAEDWSTDPASLTLNGMMDIANLDWSDRILKVIGIERDRLPPVGIPSGRAGVLSKQAAEETGLPEGLILCRGAGDQQCAAIGAGVIKQGMAEFTVGTAGVMVAHLDSVKRIQGHNLWWGGHGVPGAWDIEGGAFSLGACLRWWRDHLGRNELDDAEKRKTSVYSVMVEQAQNSRPGANGVLFHSFMASQVTPYYDAVSRGGFLGLGLYHERADLIRALLEGCANEMRMVFDAFQTDVDGGITDFRLTGGGTKSDGFVQIMTDIIGQPAKVTRERECTVLGAAILGAFGSGAFSTIDEAVDAMVAVESEFEPNTKLRDLYDEQHGIYRGFYEAMANAGQYAALNEFAEKHQ
ncbi:MAG: FGGY family carbohydrate kinase [Pseudomonadota bacterium]